MEANFSCLSIARRKKRLTLSSSCSCAHELIFESRYLFLLLSQSVPHGGDYLRYVSERGVGVLSFNGCLGVSEEQGVGWHGLRGLVGILLLLLFLGFGLGLHHLRRRPFLARDLEDQQRRKNKTAYWHCRDTWEPPAWTALLLSLFDTCVVEWFVVFIAALLKSRQQFFSSTKITFIIMNLLNLLKSLFFQLLSKSWILTFHAMDERNFKSTPVSARALMWPQNELERQMELLTDGRW